jgi:transitional endoplasmic reticulum ATPase
MTELQLTCTEGYSNDWGRCIARLDPDTLSSLDLEIGVITESTIEIEGNRTAIARVRRADREDWNTNTVRIDDFTRQNANAAVGESVTIRKAGVKHAVRVSLALSSEDSVPLGNDPAERLGRQLLYRPVLEGNAVPAWSTIDRSSDHSDSASHLDVIATEPAGAVVITEETTIDLQRENR